MTERCTIVTMLNGPDYARIGELSVPMLHRYATNIGTDFQVVTERRCPHLHMHWEKLPIISSLLEVYHRVLWVDADVIVRPDAPSIFEEFPKSAFCAFDEGKVFEDREFEMTKDAPFYYGSWDPQPSSLRGFKYFNAGVMLVGQRHRAVFELPLQAKGEPMSEQTYTNLEVAYRGLLFRDIGIRWNGLHSIKGPKDRTDLHLVHYAGWPKTADWVDKVAEQMKADYKAWGFVL